MRLVGRGDPVAGGAARIVPIDEDHFAARGTDCNDDMLGHSRRIGVARLVEAEGIPAFVIGIDELREFVSQTAQASPGVGDAALEGFLGIPGVGLALGTRRGRVADRIKT